MWMSIFAAVMSVGARRSRFPSLPMSFSRSFFNTFACVCKTIRRSSIKACIQQGKTSSKSAPQPPRFLSSHMSWKAPRVLSMPASRKTLPARAGKQPWSAASHAAISVNSEACASLSHSPHATSRKKPSWKRRTPGMQALSMTARTSAATLRPWWCAWMWAQSPDKIFTTSPLASRSGQARTVRANSSSVIASAADAPCSSAVATAPLSMASITAAVANAASHDPRLS
mmetsp:Transcript_92561/g.266189  ORF Transcript_92561/g.266189 Transcript_92561/m.266189 type:complete len:228 (+) Transcript_92561:422-1105(+)